ncbi:hypothetical protein FGG78_16120 [Thioclava sp. BHET1]|nr:hypothetical protein FGG78_16120 [Thioclava sp. BHET1]
MRFKFQMVALAASFGLAACNGSGGSSGATGGELSAADARAVDTAYSAYESRIDNGDLTPTSPSGQAKMAGYMGIGNLGDDGELTALGELNMDVDFDAGTTTGKASNFALYSGDEMTREAGVSGALDVDGTVSGSSLTARATGAVSDGESPATVDVGLDGTFYDDNGTTLVQGEVAGTVTDDDSGDVTNVDGGFYATEN